MQLHDNRTIVARIVLALLIAIIHHPVQAEHPAGPENILLAQAQIDTSKLQNKAPAPSTKDKEVDPKTISGSTRPSLRIAGVSEPTATSPSVVQVQGRGAVEKIELNFFVSVSNRGTRTEYFRIATEVDGGEAVNRTRQFTIGPGQTMRKPVRFVTEFDVPSGSTQLPIAVVLLSRGDSEIDRTGRRADMSSALRHLRGPAPTAFERDLAVSDLTMSLMRQRIDYGPVNLAKRHSPQAVVTVRNDGTERWGYSTSLTVSYQMGRPGSLRPLTGDSGYTKPQTLNLRPGEQTVIAYKAPSSLAPGYYYTATATISTRDDQNRGNNTGQFVFFIEDDGSITPVESGR